jgi:hypothetical protein
MFPVQRKNLLDLLSPLFLSILLPLSLALQVNASETENDKLQFSGFATLGMVTSDSDQYGYRKSVSSDGAVFSGDLDFKQHSLLGFQADWSISPKFDAVYQGVLRDLPESSFDRFTTLAFLRYEIDAHWSVRVGRTAPDIFLLTEYRDVDFSYIWATAPNEVYGIVPYRSIDGIDVTYSGRSLGGLFTAKLFTGSSEGEISDNSILETIKIKNVMGIALSFDNFDWIVHAKHSQVTIDNEPKSNAFLFNSINQVPDFLWPNSNEFAQSLLMTGEDVSYSSISGQYQWQRWLASAEWSQIKSKSAVLPKITSAYAALSYEMNAHQFYSVYAVTDSSTYVFDEPGVNEVVLGELIYGINEAMNFYSPNQKTVSLGWRYDISSNTAASFQWNYTKLDKSGTTLWLSNPAQPKTSENISTFFLTLSVVF